MKIEEGRLEDIRECIGCNICVTGDWTMTPIRCTQNPSMGEEWRRGWHPERFRPAGSDAKVLVVGGGPAGLEAAMALGKRGYEVDARRGGRELGGRVLREARLPGLAAWIRVVDYRRGQLAKLPNVEVALESEVTADEVRGYGFDHVAVATGARWRADGVGRWHTRPPASTGVETLTPDDLLGRAPPGGRPDPPLRRRPLLPRRRARRAARDARGSSVTLVTPAPRVSEWSVNTMEQQRIHRRLVEAGVELVDLARARRRRGWRGAPRATSTPARERELPLDGLVLVTARLPNDALALELGATAIGDAYAPGTIASAVWDGRRYAEELDGDPPGDAVPFRREVVELAPLGEEVPA